MSFSISWSKAWSSLVRRCARYAPLAAVVLLAALLDACSGASYGAGYTGDSCWSDYECNSQSCTFGTCDSDAASLLFFIADVISELAESDAGPQPPPAPAPAPCASWGGPACPATPTCQPRVVCLASYACLSEPADAGAFSCAECAIDPSCPPPCTRFSWCE